MLIGPLPEPEGASDEEVREAVPEFDRRGDGLDLGDR